MDITYKTLITEYRLGKNAAQIIREAGERDLLFRLSGNRANVLEFFPFSRDMQVLEAGLCFGAFAGLAERTAGFELKVLPGEDAELVRLMYPKLCADGRISFIEGDITKLYDVVIAALPDIRPEQAETESASVSSAEALIHEYEAYVRDGGTLIVIGNNPDALKALRGVSLSNEYGLNYKLVKKLAGRPGAHVYYPLPNAAFARDIFSDAYLPGSGDFKGISSGFNTEAEPVCDEENLYEGLAAAGCFEALAPSYMLVLTDCRRPAARAAAEPEAAAEAADEVGAAAAAGAAETEAAHAQTATAAALTLPVYIRYNRSRRPEYRLKTEIFFTEGEEERAVFGSRKAVKTALSKEGNAHIASFAAKHEQLKEDLEGRLEVVRPYMSETVNGLKSAAFPFIEGARKLSAVITDSITDGRVPYERLGSILNVILGENGEPVRDADILLENILCDSEGRLHLIDYEWSSKEPEDRDFVRFRILSYWYESVRQALTECESRNAFLKGFGYTEHDIEVYDLREKEFQSGVSAGEGEGTGIIKEGFSSAAVRQQRARIDELTEWNLRLQDEIEEHKTALSKEREVERLSQNHIRNIERINESLKNELAASASELAYLRRHQSLLSRLKAAVIRRIDAWAPAETRKRKLLHYAAGTVKHPGVYLKRYLTAEGRQFIKGDFNIGGEFSEGGMLNVPETEAPLVSIVIPAYNQVAYTYACVRSVISNTDFQETPYEIILADDVSTDATQYIGEFIRGMVISRNSSNMGFLKNCNQAAAKARGRYIFFLNNDTKVHEGWLSSLVRLMESDPSIGMAGSKLVYPDGRLQEAGGIIWSDASGWNYGRLQDPELPEFNYVKDVDYISGAAIMLSRALWEEIGGFDERFAPAYCEDSDLAFEVRRHGKRVVYQPQSVVTHFEGISNGTDVNGSGLKRYQQVNQQKFKEKWAEELKKQSVNTGDPNPFAARDRSQGRKCIVVIDHYVPTWDKDAGSRTTYQYIKMFIKLGFNVKFIGDNFLHEEPYTSALQQLGCEVIYGLEYRDSIFSWFEKNSSFIDICYLNRPHIAVKYIDWLKKHTDIKCIFYGHDLHFLRILREYELSGDIRKKRESDYWRSVEFSVMQQADMSYYPSEAEIKEIHKFHREIPAKAITAYLWDEFKDRSITPEEVLKRDGLLFVGGFKHPPNADAVKWFLEKVFPAVKKAVPGIRFRVAGSGAGEDIQKLGKEDGQVEILGFVSDERLEELYRETRLTVVPLRYGAGVKGKVVEALKNGTAVVTTLVGSEGIPESDTVLVNARGGFDTQEEDDRTAAELASCIISLYSDADAIAGLINGTSDYMRRYFSTEAAWEVIREDFEV